MAVDIAAIPIKSRKQVELNLIVPADPSKTLKYAVPLPESGMVYLIEKIGEESTALA